MVTQQNFFKRWFPTFVSLFEQFKGDQTGGKVLHSSEIQGKSRTDAPFFLQGLEQWDLSELSSREQLLESLEWVKPALGNRGFSATAPLSEPPLSELAIAEPEIPLAPMLRPIPTFFPTSAASPPDIDPDPHFFIRGLGLTESLENFKNTDLLAVLAWEEQGQTLQEVDPDDYELLDDLLDMADP